MNRALPLLTLLLAVVAIVFAALSMRSSREVLAEVRALADRLPAEGTSGPPPPAGRPATSFPDAGPARAAPPRSDAPLAEPPPPRAALAAPETLQLDQQRQAWLAQVRADVAAEPRDAIWAAKTETTLVEASTHEDLASSVDALEDFKAECRSKHCLVEARFSNRGAAMEWQGIYLLNAPPLARTVTSMTANADGTYTIYLYGRGDD